MKKSKILIPALSIASVGSVVAPMAAMTSCNPKKQNATFSKSLTLIKDKVAIQGSDFKPEVEPLAKGTQFDCYGYDYYKSESYDMNARYYYDVKKQPVILADDLLYTFAKSAQQVSEWGAENMTVTIVNPYIKLEYRLDQISGELEPVLCWNWTTKVYWDTTVDGKKYKENIEFTYHDITNAWYFEQGNLDKARNVWHAYFDSYQYRQITLDEKMYIEFKEQRFNPDGTVYNEKVILDSYEKLQTFMTRYKFDYNFFIYNMKFQPKYFENVVSTPRYSMNYNAGSGYYDAGYYYNGNPASGSIDTVKGRRCQFDVTPTTDMNINKFNLGYYDEESTEWKYVEFGAVSVKKINGNVATKVDHVMNAANNELTINTPITNGERIIIEVITSDVEKTVVPYAFYKA